MSFSSTQVSLLTGFTLMVVLVVIFLAASLKVRREDERGVVFRLGWVIKPKGPGLIILIPAIDRMVKVPLRLLTMDVSPQDVITRDNVSVKVNAVVYFRVMAPVKAVVQVEDYLYATSQLAQTTLRAVCGQAELGLILSERENINNRLQKRLDIYTDPWGVKVANVEVKYIDLPQEMQRAMAKQGRGRARAPGQGLINAEGEYQAAAIIAEHPQALQLCATCRLCARWPPRTTRPRFSRCPWTWVNPFLELVKREPHQP
jgi:regulator of protease activity HflC (stomatin/prohibitin superfamily)